MPDLTVWSVCVGEKYDSGYVYALQEAVAKNLSIPHRFRCITKRNLPGIETRNPPVSYSGWWSKIGLFAPLVATGPSLYFDLDVVITGSLDYLVEFTKYEFAAPANWARSGYGGIQSSVMAWRGNWTAPFAKISGEWPHRVVDAEGYTTLGGKKFWGDQEYLWDMLGDRWGRIPRVCSYKYHVLQLGRIPDDVSVVVFHGEPKPIDVSDECILPFTSILRRNINGNTRSGYQQAVSDTA